MYLKKFVNRKEWEKINLEQLWKNSIRDEYGRQLNKAWTEEEVEKEVNLDLEIQWEQIKTDMKNTAVDILWYKERKDGKEWFDEECRQLLEQKIKVFQAYLARMTRANRAECEERRKLVIIACRKERNGLSTSNSLQ